MRPKGLPKTGGRAAGTPNKATADLRKAVSDLIEMNWGRVQEDLDTLEPKDRLMIMEKLLSYSLPKLSAVTQENITASNLNRLSDEQLNQLIEAIINNDQQNGQTAINQRNNHQGCGIA